MMTTNPNPHDPADPGRPEPLADHLISALELCRLCCVPQQWLTERVQQGLIEVQGEAWEQWRFDALGLRRARRMFHLELHFEAVPELAALVVDLEQEIARLRQRQNR